MLPEQAAALLPGLPGSTPSLLVYNLSTPYFTTPKTVGGSSQNLEVLRDMRVFVIPDQTTDRVADVLPSNATSLPFVLSPSKAPRKLDAVKTSKLVLPDVTMNLLEQLSVSWCLPCRACLLMVLM